MNIEVGKFYRTRNGKKARIYAIDGGNYPIHGAVWQGESEGWDEETWEVGGSYCGRGKAGLDIIEEWKDEIFFDWSCLPAWANMYIAMDDDGEWGGYTFEPSHSPEEGFWFCSTNENCVIPVEYCPQGFTGDWTESLMKNPKYTKK